MENITVEKRKRPDDWEWKVEKRLRKWFAKKFYGLVVFLIKVAAIVFVLYFIWFMISYLGGRDFVLFIIEVTADTGKFVLTRLQNNTMGS